MALRFYDGFDHYNDGTTLVQKWGIGSSYYGGWSAGRYGGNCLRIGQGNGGVGVGPTRTFDNQGTWTVGCAYQSSATPILFRWYDGATLQADCYVAVNGNYIVRRGGTTVVASGGTYASGSWVYVEVKIVFHGSAGSVLIKVNGTQIANVTGINTIVSANAYASKIVFGEGSGTWQDGYIDDVYICDGTDGTATQGAANDGPLCTSPDGMRVFTGVPTGAGATSNFTPTGAATGWQATDDLPNNGDTDYAGSATINHVDTYAMTDLPASASSVVAVQLTEVIRKDDAGTRSVAPVLRPVATDRVGTTTPIVDTYAPYWFTYPLNPETNAVWAVSEVNATEVGIKNVA